MKYYEVVLYDRESPAYATTIKKNVLHIKYVYWLGNLRNCADMWRDYLEGKI